MTDTNDRADRQPLPPDPQKVEALVEIMARAAADYAGANNCSMSDIFSATMTMTWRTVNQVLYHTQPPMTIRETFFMRRTIIKGIERLWSAVAGGGPTSKFGAH